MQEVRKASQETMKLWILKALHADQGKKENFAPWNPWSNPYDCNVEVLVRAENENIARAYAADRCGDECEEAWLESRFSSCEELTQDGHVGVLMVDCLEG